MVMINDARDKQATVDAIMRDARAAAADYDVIGVRVDEVDYQIGDILPASRVWIDGYVTDEVLPGTCAINASAPGAIAAAIDLYYGHHVLLVGGMSEGSGDDEDEVIIGNARVIARYTK